jgi:hypothetical protein
MDRELPMSPSEFERLVEAVIPVAGRTSLTLTETPATVDDLLSLLERALVIGNRRGAPLHEIHAPLADLPDCASTFWHVPIEDSSREGVVRLVFERQELPTAA